ncbi:MAG: hypothetical protein QG608_3525 [Actinomycetota bacterium]|nr:hypothetical protein [Actinomycetota bacterium]
MRRMTEAVSGLVNTDDDVRRAEPASPPKGADLPRGGDLEPDRPDGVGKRHNCDVEWEDFDSGSYWNHNYRSLREDDREIIRTVGSFFRKCFLGIPTDGLSGVDVGSGTNMYPALAMLPWCEKIELIDHSVRNVEWLQSEVSSLRSTWRPFWDELCSVGYERKDFPRVRAAIAGSTRVVRSNVFELTENTYDIGTMFFVAESMTDDENEFEKATECFLRSLRPGAPFAAAFMDSSEGYVVGDKLFPAVHEVTKTRVENVLAGLVADGEVTVDKIRVPPTDPLRDGYEGMLIAVGRTRGNP